MSNPIRSQKEPQSESLRNLPQRDVRDTRARALDEFMLYHSVASRWSCFIFLDRRPESVSLGVVWITL